MTTTSRLRALIDRAEILVAPGAYDPLTAKIVQDVGFECVYMTGAGTVNGQLGIPDIGLATMTEMADAAARIAGAVEVPVLCDADTGFGDPMAVARTVRAYERAGAAGLHLEDQVMPKRCGHLAGKAVVPPGEMEGKIRAACDARRDDDLVVVARTDAVAVEGLEAAIDRAGRYVEAGADLIFTEALGAREEFQQFRDAGVGAPLLANMTEFGKTPYLSAADFERLGYAVVIFPMAIFRSAMGAARRAAETLWHEGSQRELLDGMQSRAELYELLDYDAYAEDERRFLE